MDRVSRTKLDLNSMDPLRIQKQIALHHLSQSYYNVQVSCSNKHLSLGGSQSLQPTYKKQIRLENRSSCGNSSRLIVYPVCSMLDQGNNSSETVCQLLDSDRGHQRNEKSCMVECSNGLLVRVKVTLLSDAVFCQHERLVWFEIAPNEAITLALDFDYGTKHFTEFERKFHQNFTIALFWIESDVNMCCIQGKFKTINDRQHRHLIDIFIKRTVFFLKKKKL